jgi:hypothetical protein
MSSRLLYIAAALDFAVASGAALACTGAKVRSAYGSQQQNASTAYKASGG